MKAFAGVLAWLACSTACAASSPLTPATISASISERGAEATIATLAKAGRWDFVAEQVASGIADWVALAPKLAPGADAGSAEDLGISLAFALPKNPKAVLAALDPADGHVIGAHRVCGMPFIEDTVKDLPAYKRRATQAVQGISDPARADAKAACLAALKAN